MTDTTLTTIGIIGQSIPVVMVLVYMPLVNWIIKHNILSFQKDCNTLWFYYNGKINRSISLRYYKSWEKRIYRVWDNGAKKGRKGDTCFDFNINFGRWAFSYTNWNYNYKLNNNK